MRSRRLREAKLLAWGHTASKWQSRDTYLCPILPAFLAMNLEQTSSSCGVILAFPLFLNWKWFTPLLLSVVCDLSVTCEHLLYLPVTRVVCVSVMCICCMCFMCACLIYLCVTHVCHVCCVHTCMWCVSCVCHMCVMCVAYVVCLWCVWCLSVCGVGAHVVAGCTHGASWAAGGASVLSVPLTLVLPTALPPLVGCALG